MIYIFISLTSFFYISAAFFFGLYLKRLSLLSLRYGQFLVATGLLVHFLILLWNIQNGDSSFQNASLISNLSVSGLASLIALILAIRRRALIISVIILPTVSLSMFLISFLSERYVSDALPTLWLWTHIGLMILGELTFFISATTAAAYLIVYRILRKKHGLQVLTTLSSLPALDRVLGILLFTGFCLLSIGLLLGLIFAQQFWQGAWWRDAKVIFAALIWIAYGILVSARFVLPSFKGYRSAVSALIGFVCILFLSAGIDFIFPTQHQGIPERSPSLIEETQ